YRGWQPHGQRRVRVQNSQAQCNPFLPGGARGLADVRTPESAPEGIWQPGNVPGIGEASVIKIMSYDQRYIATCMWQCTSAMWQSTRKQQRFVTDTDGCARSDLLLPKV